MMKPRFSCRWLIDEQEASLAVRSWRREICSRSCDRAAAETVFTVIFTGRAPMEGESRPGAKLVLWVDERIAPEAGWLEIVRAWHPWRVLVSHLPGELRDDIPEDIRSILLWLPPGVPTIPMIPAATSIRPIVLLLDKNDDRLVRWKSSYAERFEERWVPWKMFDEYASAALGWEIVDVSDALLDAKTRSKIVRARLIVSAVRDEVIAHAMRNLADQSGVLYCNLSCTSASPLRALGAAVIGDQGVERIRELISPVLRMANGSAKPQSSATPSDFDSWLEFVQAEALAHVPTEPGWQAIHLLLRTGLPRLDPPSARLALGLRIAATDSRLAPAVARLQPNDLAESWVLEFLREWPATEWSGRFAELWHRVSSWTEMCAAAVKALAASPAVRDPRGRAAWGVFHGVCGEFATAWRREPLLNAVAWWAEDRRDGRMSSEMRTKEIVARAVLGQVEEVDGLLTLDSSPREPLGACTAMALLRDIMPAIEDNQGAGDTLLKLSAARRWIALDRKDARPSRGAAGAEILVEVYSGRYEAALEAVQTIGSVEWGPVGAIYLWLNDAQDHARQCLEFVTSAKHAIPASRLLPLATVHAVFGDPMKGAAYLREAHSALPDLMHPKGLANLRWLCLALALRALGCEREALIWRERARRWHPQGEQRDRHFMRVSARTSVSSLPSFSIDSLTLGAV